MLVLYTRAAKLENRSCKGCCGKLVQLSLQSGAINVLLEIKCNFALKSEIQRVLFMTGETLS